MKTSIHSFIFCVGICISVGAGSAAFGAIHPHDVNHRMIFKAHPDAYMLNFDSPAAGRALLGCAWGGSC